MFLRAVKPRRSEAIPAPQPIVDETLAYFTPETLTRNLRDLDAIEQMFGYWARD
ncbi:hypothetical protein [Gemmobacter serpentinus]|uniref:hypothetical protein n=1 Tax=Gemmobacter serpentinus TaxID=2652247 RepID=UPI0018657BF6|nr:hypothetical protein [Gemmobacter serpentinus]